MLCISKALRKFLGFTIMLLHHLKTLSVTRDLQRTLIVGTSRQICFTNLIQTYNLPFRKAYKQKCYPQYFLKLNLKKASNTMF